MKNMEVLGSNDKSKIKDEKIPGDSQLIVATDGGDMIRTIFEDSSCGKSDNLNVSGDINNDQVSDINNDEVSDNSKNKNSRIVDVYSATVAAPSLSTISTKYYKKDVKSVNNNESYNAKLLLGELHKHIEMLDMNNKIIERVRESCDENNEINNDGNNKDKDKDDNVTNNNNNHNNHNSNNYNSYDNNYNSRNDNYKNHTNNDKRSNEKSENDMYNDKLDNYDQLNTNDDGKIKNNDFNNSMVNTLSENHTDNGNLYGKLYSKNLNSELLGALNNENVFYLSLYISFSLFSLLVLSLFV